MVWVKWHPFPFTKRFVSLLLILSTSKLVVLCLPKVTYFHMIQKTTSTIFASSPTDDTCTENPSSFPPLPPSFWLSHSVIFAILPHPPQSLCFTFYFFPCLSPIFFFLFRPESPTYLLLLLLTTQPPQQGEGLGGSLRFLFLFFSNTPSPPNLSLFVLHTMNGIRKCFLLI